MKKERVQIPQDTAATIQFISDRTCCVCNIPGKPIQIHHIDENPANNHIDNLTVLCLDCHNDTMIKGGFSRKLDASQVIMYRNSWIERVKARRENADKIASISAVTGIADDEPFDNYSPINYKTNTSPEVLQQYLDRIVIIRDAQITIAQTYWDTGVTLEMNIGNSIIIDFLEEVLIELASFYPVGHFNKIHPKVYFNEVISGRHIWHRLLLEPDGIGTGGSMVSILVGGNVIEDVHGFVLDVVNSLLFPYLMEGTLDIEDWKQKWISGKNRE